VRLVGLGQGGQFAQAPPLRASAVGLGFHQKPHLREHLPGCSFGGHLRDPNTLPPEY
jgi:hypothetical protein